MAGPEARLRSRIVRACIERGWWVRVQHASALTGRGRADLLVSAEGRTVLIEVKTVDGKVAPWQRDRILEARRKGTPGFVARNVDDALLGVESVLAERFFAMDFKDLDFSFLESGSSRAETKAAKPSLDIGFGDNGQEAPETVEYTDVELAAVLPGADEEADAAASEEKPRRKRRTKAQIEADNLAAEHTRKASLGPAPSSEDEPPKTFDIPYVPNLEPITLAADESGYALRQSAKGKEARVEAINQIVESLHGLIDGVARYLLSS